VFQTGNRLPKRLVEVQLKIIITDAALHIRSQKIQKRPRIGLSALFGTTELNLILPHKYAVAPNPGGPFLPSLSPLQSIQKHLYSNSELSFEKTK